MTSDWLLHRDHDCAAEACGVAICEHLNRHIFYPSGTKCAECGAKVPERQPREAKEEPVSEFADSIRKGRIKRIEALTAERDDLLAQVEKLTKEVAYWKASTRIAVAEAERLESLRRLSSPGRRCWGFE